MKEWLNYHHRLYFWLVVREGGLAPAAAKLRLSPPTLSAQVHALENALGEKLLEKRRKPTRTPSDAAAGFRRSAAATSAPGGRPRDR